MIMYELFNKKTTTESTNMLCWTCLSTEGEVAELGQHKDMYCHIMRFNNLELEQEFLSSVRVCWECSGLLQRVTDFHSRAVHASEMLDTVKNKDLIKEEEPILDPMDSKAKLSTQIVDPMELKIEVNEFSEICYSSPHGSANSDTKPPELSDYLKEEDSMSSDDSTKKKDNSNKKKKKTTKKSKKPKVEYKLVEAKIEDYIESEHMEQITVSREQVMEYRKKIIKREFFASKPYKCKHCIIGFDDKSEYTKHFETPPHGDVKGQYACDICEIKFHKAKEREIHVKKHYLWYKCKLCGFSHASKRAFKTHNEKHKKRVMRQCLRCKMIFETHAELRKHFDVHSLYRCDHCPRKYRSRSIFKNHLRKHGFNAPLKCKQCNSMFKTRARLREHNELTHGQAPKEQRYCVECDRTYDTISKYRSHQAYKHGGKIKKRTPSTKKWPCPRCTKVYRSSATMRHHIRKIHEGINDPKDCVCPHCHKNFNKRNLRKHIRIHTGERPHPCAYCDWSFKQRTTLVEHVMRRHNIDIREHKQTDEHQYKSKLTKKAKEPAEQRHCNQCNKVFRSILAYKRHCYNVHRQKFSCNQCEREFCSYYALKEHVDSFHDKTIKFICEEHNKEYTSKLGLQQHIKFVHKRSDDFICHYCAHGFPNKQNLLRHIIIHTGEKPYKCPQCTSAFNTQGGMKSHVEHVHMKLPWRPRAPKNNAHRKHDAYQHLLVAPHNPCLIKRDDHNSLSLGHE